MADVLLNLVCKKDLGGTAHANIHIEHTLLVTETGVEILTARKENSPGGPIPMPTASNEVSQG